MPDDEPTEPRDARVEPESAPTLIDIRPRSAPPSALAAIAAREATGDKTGGTHGTAHSTSVITARETLQVQEIAQTRAFVRLASVLAVVVAIAILFLGGDRTARTILHGTLAAVVVVCAWLGFSLRTDEGYRIEKVLVAAFVCVGAAFAAVYYFGVFSPAVVIIPFGLCFFSAGASTRGTLGVLVGCAVTELFLGASISAGALADRGIVRAENVSAFEKLAIITLIEAIFLATYLIMRASRAATLNAIELHDQALAQVSQREALLKEARQDLRAALDAGGQGRYSERTIGRFMLGRVIGRGAMGEVYEGHHVATREEVAVKILLDHVLAQPEHVQRFFREAKIVSSFTVPNVVKVIGVADIDAPIPYIAMERLHGVDLSDWLREHRRMSFAKLLGLIRQVGVGLDAARAAGIVHRDLKPRNVFLAKKGESETWKILDFGVSKLTADDQTLTRDRIVGTPTYMAPEQIDRGKVDHRTDLFALGIITYRALTGRPAFSGDSEAQILYRVVHSMPPRPSELLAVPPEVDLVMAVALAKDSEDRFDSANELATALDAAAQGNIDPALSARAQKILSRHPWGT